MRCPRKKSIEFGQPILWKWTNLVTKPILWKWTNLALETIRWTSGNRGLGSEKRKYLKWLLAQSVAPKAVVKALLNRRE